MSAGGRGGPTLRALWNLWPLGLFLLGPVAGVMLGATVFGMPGALIRLAAVVLLFSLAMFGLLVRGERRRLTRPHDPRPPGRVP